MSNSAEYTIYQGMIQRCENPKRRGYHRYGGRGIKVCPRWRVGEGGKTGFECFYEDMGPKPEGKSLDRWPNPDGDYEPGNVVWSSMAEQAVHKSGASSDVVANEDVKPKPIPTGQRVRMGRTYDDVDWTLPNLTIAAMKGVTHTAIANQRKRLAPGTKGIRAKPGPKKKSLPRVDRRSLPRVLVRDVGVSERLEIDWATVDWSQGNLGLAESLGVSITTVDKKRGEYA